MLFKPLGRILTDISYHRVLSTDTTQVTREGKPDTMGKCADRKGIRGGGGGEEKVKLSAGIITTVISATSTTSATSSSSTTTTTV